MKLKDLKICYIYSPIKNKVDGETRINWQYKDTLRLNVQQDINELDVNEAGIIDYDKLKIRVDYEVDIKKGDGISLVELEIENNFAKEKPKYKVISMPKVGTTTTYTCEIYHGE